MKIALVAMSGIRVCDTELLRLGLTLPGFVERSKTIASLPSLGLLTLAGMMLGEHLFHRGIFGNHGIPHSCIAAGSILIVTGLVLLRRFIRQYPLK